MITLVSEAIPALPNRSDDSAFTQLRHVFMSIPGGHVDEVYLEMNADTASNCEISAANAVLFLN